jgi:2-polyprenyl-6-methoxyphenol hydroxylase-like FAD-dependent oxidoreductase
MTLGRPSVVIVGGGIGGLFVANALMMHGLEVAVYDQAPAARLAPGFTSRRTASAIYKGSGSAPRSRSGARKSAKIPATITTMER